VRLHLKTWYIVQTLKKKERPHEPTAVHSPVGITYHPNEKLNVITDYLEKQLTFQTCEVMAIWEGRYHSPSASLLCRRHPVAKYEPVTYTI
jgi:hypothetical protein